VTPRVAVLVPLHRSARFIDVVEGNLRRLARVAHLVVSDADEADGTLAELRQRIADDVDVVWLGRRDIAQGWIAHYNDLVARVEHEHFMWLPHDDEIDAIYLERCLEVLDAQPGVPGAVGSIANILGPDLLDVGMPDHPHADDAGAWVSEANRLLFEWNLGIGFRSVFRAGAVGPIRPTTPASEWADIVWVYGVCLEQPVAYVPAAPYRKRFYASSTHAGWRREIHPHGLPFLLREVLDRPALPRHAEVLHELVARSAEHSGAVLEATLVHVRNLEAQARIDAEERSAAPPVDRSPNLRSIAADVRRLVGDQAGRGHGQHRRDRR
jgi:hypothetical protein